MARRRIKQGEVPPLDVRAEQGGSRASSGFLFQDVVVLALLIQSRLGVEDYDALFVEVGNDILARVKGHHPARFDVIQVTTQRPSSGRYYKPNDPKLVRSVLGFAKNESEAGSRIRNYVFYCSHQIASGSATEDFRADLLAAAQEACRHDSPELEALLPQVIERLRVPDTLPSENAPDLLLTKYVSQLPEAALKATRFLKDGISGALGKVQQVRAALPEDLNVNVTDLLSRNAEDMLKVQKAVYVDQILEILQLDSAPPERGSVQDSVEQYLDRLELRCRRQCVRSLEIIGASSDVASRFADQLGNSIQTQYVADSTRPLVQYYGPLGAGKTHAALSLTAHLVERRRGNATAPLPVLITLAESRGFTSVEQLVRDATGLPATAEDNGVALVVDGADELGREKLYAMASQCFAAVGRQPSWTCTLTSRELLEAGSGFNAIQLPTRDEASTRTIIETASGREADEATFRRLQRHLGDAVHFPLMAWLAGLAITSGTGVGVYSRTALVRNLVHRALVRVPQARTGNVHEALRRLGSTLVERPNQVIARAEFGNESEVNQLYQTGLVAAQDGNLRFTMPFLAEWFAGAALQYDQALLDRAMAGLAKTDSWKEPFLFAIDELSEERLDRALEKLVSVDMGGLFDLLRSHLNNRGRVHQYQIGTEENAGSRLARAAGALVKNAGKLGTMFRPFIDDNGELVSVGVAKQGDMLVVDCSKRRPDRQSYYVMSPDERNPRVRAGKLDLPNFEMPEGGRWIEIRDGTQTLAATEDTPLWPWVWVVKEASKFLNLLLDGKAFMTGEGPLIIEQCWCTAKEISGIGATSGRDPVLAVDSLIAGVQVLLKEITNEEPKLMRPCGEPIRRWQLVALDSLLRQLKERGVAKWQGQLPAADDPLTESPFVWSDYSYRGMKARIESVYTLAQQAYKTLVDAWFGALAPRLRHYVYFPATLRARIVVDPSYRTDRAHVGIGWSYYYEPLPKGAAPKSEVSITFVPGQVGWPDENWDDQILQKSLDELSAYRSYVPRNCGYLAAIGVLPAAPFHGDPIHQIVFGWLREDLNSIGLKVDLRAV